MARYLLICFTGTCIKNVNNVEQPVRCKCPQGFLGPLCELDPCQNKRCLNGGNCSHGKSLCYI